jgi:proline iminopeptidase
MSHGSARERFLAFRKKQGKSPPLAQQTVQARGLDFAVYTSPQVEGQLPLICINGGLHFGHDVLWPALAPLSVNRQLIFFDQRGRGKSQAPPAARTSRIEYDAGDANAIRVALGIDRWNILGHSWGGGIAMLATAGDPDAVDRLVLVDAVGPTSEWLTKLHPAALARLTGERRDALEKLDPRSLHVDDIAAHAAYTSALYPAWFSDREFASIFSSPRANSSTGAAVAARLRREGYDWTARISTISTPTLIVHGDHDLLDVRVAESIARLIPHSELSIIAHAGHMPFWEAPEEFFARVENFLHPRAG